MTREEAVAQWTETWRSLRAWGRTLEEVWVEYRKRDNGSYSTGRAWPGIRRIVITHGSDMPDALGTVLHELAHLAVPASEHHGANWRQMYAASVAEVTGRPIVGAEFLSYRLLQDAITDVMRSWWKDQGLDRIWALAKDS